MMKSLAPVCVEERGPASPVIGDPVTYSRPQLECPPVTKCGIEFSLEDIQHVSEIAPVICHIISATWLVPLAEMDGSGNSGPVCHREWQRRNFHQVLPGLPSGHHSTSRQAHPAARGPTSVESDHHVWDIS